VDFLFNLNKLRNFLMDYLTNFYKNKAQVLSEQVAILEAKLASLQEDAPASTFSGTGQGQQTFSDEQLRDQMRQHKRTGLFGAQVDDAKQDQEYRDAQAELNRRSSTASAKPAPQPQSQPQARQSAPQQTSTPKPQAQPQPQSAPVDRSQLYTGDDSWLKDATAPAKLPGSFAGDRGDSGNAPKSSEPTRHYGEPATLPQQEKPKFDVMSATRNLLDQMNQKAAGSQQKTPTPTQTSTPRNIVQGTNNPKVSYYVPNKVEQPKDNRNNLGVIQLIGKDTPGNRAELEKELGYNPKRRNPITQTTPATPATPGVDVEGPASPAPEEQHTLMGDLGHAFYDAGRALFNLPRDVNKALKNGTGVNYEAFPGARK
jgi:hypothetical protein